VFISNFKKIKFEITLQFDFILNSKTDYNYQLKMYKESSFGMIYVLTFEYKDWTSRQVFSKIDIFIFESVFLQIIRVI